MLTVKRQRKSESYNNPFDAIPFDPIKIISSFLDDISYWKFRLSCGTALRLPIILPIDVELRLFALRFIRGQYTLFQNQMHKAKNHCVFYSRRKEFPNWEYHLIEFTFPSGITIVIKINDCRHYFYLRAWCGTVSMASSKVGNKMTTYIGDTGCGFAGISCADFLNVRMFPAFKDYFISLKDAVDQTSYREKCANLFSEILN